jgi:hypothetical protein
MPIESYPTWNVRPSDLKEKIEPYRKYIFICEGAKTEPSYFANLIDLRKQLGIHPLIDLRLWKKTGKDKDISYPKKLYEFAQEQKALEINEFDPEYDKMIIIFDADIFEEKVQGYDELIQAIEKTDIAGITNPAFELFLLLHIPNSFETDILGQEEKFFQGNYAYHCLLQHTGMNAKKNENIGTLAANIKTAIEQEKKLNQDIHCAKGKITSNIGHIIEQILNENPDI